MDSLYTKDMHQHLEVNSKSNLWNLQHENISALEFLSYTENEIMQAYTSNLLHKTNSKNNS